MILLIAALAAAGLMTLAWAVVRVTGNGGWTDVFWTASVGSMAAWAALQPAEGASPIRQGIVATLVAIWAVRLGGYILMRTWRSGHVDPRYETLKRSWGGWGWKAWGFLMIQAATILVLVIAVRAAAARPDPVVGWREGLAAVILLIAVAGEYLADRQMAAFRRNPANADKVAHVGLWAWSRHPNYFFEWLGWLAYPVMALRLDYAAGWLSLLAPALMWWLLNHVSGVPPLEAQMLKTRPQAYRAYQDRVSRFFPRPPRSIA
jgi:steroid 5-alpha reductase family enzyme